MATLEDMARQIGVAQDLQSVVRTMKAISAVSIRRHERAEAAMAQYLDNVELGLQVVLRAVQAPPAVQPRLAHKTAVVLVGSEIGLCGAFNERLTDFALHHLAQTCPDPADRLVLSIGARAQASWAAVAARASDAHQDAPATVEALARSVAAVLHQLETWRATDGAARLVLFHQRTGAHGVAEPEMLQLLPLDPDWLTALQARPWGSRRLPIPFGPADDLLAGLIRQLLFARVFTAIVQSRSAEHAERLRAMQAADSSIADKLEAMHVSHRRMRQDVITAELLDLISGYEASQPQEP